MSQGIRKSVDLQADSQVLGGFMTQYVIQFTKDKQERYIGPVADANTAESTFQKIIGDPSCAHIRLIKYETPMFNVFEALPPSKH